MEFKENQAEITHNLDKRIEALELVKFDPDRTLVLINLINCARQVDDDEAMVIISTLFKKVKMTGLLPHIRNVMRHRRGQKPGIVKVEFDSVEWKVEVLKNKDGITAHEEYARVFFF